MKSVILQNPICSGEPCLADTSQHLLIMTPDTASSRAAMRAEVPTDRPSARWERDG